MAGATGSGKSTQFPQFILDRAEALRAAGCSHTATNKDATASGLLPQPSEVRVVVTEPRRIAAMALATRVAEERGEEIIFGDDDGKSNNTNSGKSAGTVGYSIRHESQQSQNTRLLYCTVGILLRRITSSRFRAQSRGKSTLNPMDDGYWTEPESPFIQRLLQSLSNVTHIVIDEVHERGKMTDFLLIIVKHTLPHRRDLRLILMSATLDAQLFSDYFGGAPVVEVEGRTFPVDVFHAHELLASLPRACNRISRFPLDPISHPARLSNDPMQGLPPGAGPGAVPPSDAADAAATAYLVRLEESFGPTVTRAALAMDTRKLRGNTDLTLFMDLLLYITDREITAAELDAMGSAKAGSKLATAKRSGKVWVTEDTGKGGKKAGGANRLAAAAPITSVSSKSAKVVKSEFDYDADTDAAPAPAAPSGADRLTAAFGGLTLATDSAANAGGVQLFDEFGFPIAASAVSSPPAPGFAAGLFPTAAHDARSHRGRRGGSGPDAEPSTPSVIAQLEADDAAHGHPWRGPGATLNEDEDEDDDEDDGKAEKAKAKAAKTAEEEEAAKPAKRHTAAASAAANKSFKGGKGGRGGAGSSDTLSDLPAHCPGLPPRAELPYGAILVFLPSWDSITEIMTEIEMHPVLGDKSRFWIVPLHSSLTSEEQRDAFVRPERGQWKIILSTNIAETSVTVEDIVYVIDFGLVKEKLFDAKANISTFGPTWIARANATQRAGRAGRVRRGFCFRLYSEMFTTQMAPTALPELLCTPLEDIVLNVKALLMGPPEDKRDRERQQRNKTSNNRRGGRNNNSSYGEEEDDDEDNDDDEEEDAGHPTRVGETMAFLARAIEPPEEAFVTKSIKDLMRLNALDNDEYITEIGRFFITMPLEARHARMLLLAALLGVFDPVLTFVAASSCAPLFVVGAKDERDAIRANIKCFAGDSESDTMATLGAFNECVAASDRKGFCVANYMKFAVFIAIVRTKQQLLQIFKSAPALRSVVPERCLINFAGKLIIPGAEEDANGRAREAHFNCNAHHLPLVEAVIGAGLYPQIGALQAKGKNPRASALLRPPVGNVGLAFHSLAATSSGPAPCSLVGYGEVVGTPSLTLRSITFLSPLAALVLAPANKTVLEYDTNVVGAYVEKYNNMLDAQGGNTALRPGQQRPRGILHIDEWLGVEMDIASVSNMQLLRGLISALYQLAATRGLSGQARALGFHLGELIADALQGAAEQRRMANANEEGLKTSLSLPVGLQGRGGAQQQQKQKPKGGRGRR